MPATQTLNPQVRNSPSPPSDKPPCNGSILPVARAPVLATVVVRRRMLEEIDEDKTL
jgi:hypothetical protein